MELRASAVSRYHQANRLRLRASRRSSCIHADQPPRRNASNGEQLTHLQNEQQNGRRTIATRQQQ